MEEDSWERIRPSLPPGVNFTNILRAHKLLVDPKRAKKTVKLSSFFALLGSASVKAARRTLVKLNLADVNATGQIYGLNFKTESLAENQKKGRMTLWLKQLWRGL